MKKLLMVNFLLRILGMGISFIYIPQVLKFLGVEYYGIWATILSVLSWINFFDVGIGNSLRTTLVEYIENDDKISAKKLVTNAYLNISLISTVIFVLAILLLKYTDMQNLLGIKYERLNELIFLAIIFVNFNFVLSLCKPIYYAFQKSSAVSLIEISSQLLNLLGIVCLIYFKLNRSIIYVCILYGVTSLLSNCVFSAYLFKQNPYLIPRLKFYDKKLNSKLNGLGLKFFLLQIACLILFTTDSIIITKLFGVQEVTPYNLSNKIFGIIISLYGILLTPIWSRVSKEKNNGNYIWIKKTLKNLQLFSLVVGVGILGLYIVYPFISKIWLGQDIVYPQNLILYMSIYTMLSIWCNNYAYIMNGLGDVNLQVGIAIVQAVINIPLSIYLGKYLNYGVSGVILATNICMLIPATLFPIVFKIKEK
ncbi:MAG: lipopolysaccharide biosynthesis protein [Fusobacteriaceae bacterium]